MSRSNKLSMRRIRRFLKNKEGTAAIEFAILAIPFFALLFGILELAIVFFMSSNLNHAVSEVGRQIRTGNFQACGSPEKFKELVCEEMAGNGICSKVLRIDVVSGNDFSSITLADVPPPPGEDPDNPGETLDVENGEWDANAENASVPVVIRGLYYHPLALPSEFTRLSNVDSQNIRVLAATTAFKNEPFPAPGECPGA